MRNSRILSKIRNGERALSVCLHLVDPTVFELASLMGVDAIWMDLEHHSYSLETAAGLMRAARVGNTDIVARPGKGEFMRMARLLEIGATGIMYPRCESADEAREVVRWAKFAPLGKRGFDGSGADMPYCSMPVKEYIRAANEQTFVLIQIEEPHAIEQAEAIAAVPGVEMIMLGPADFSVLTAIPGQLDHPSVDAATRAIAKAAKNAGKHWAATCGSVQQAKQLIDLGVSLLFYGADIVMVKQGLEAACGSFARQLNIKIQSRLPGGSGYLEST